MDSISAGMGSLQTSINHGVERLMRTFESYAIQLKNGFASVLWSLGDWLARANVAIAYNLFKLFYPLLKFSFYILFSFVMAHIVYYIMYKLFFPVDLIEEPLHFDYLATPSPVAKVRLSSTEKQWYYLNGEMKSSPFICQRFFHVTSEYEIALNFRLSLSERNREIGKCMITLEMVDCSGDVIGQSNRVLRMPFQSHTVSWLDMAIKWPFYLTGSARESVGVLVPMMNNYKEGSRAATPTDMVEVRLSSAGAEMDIESASLTIVPLPKGIGYFLYFFPYSTFFAGILFLFYFFCSLGIVIRVGRMAWVRGLFSFFFDDDEDEDSEDQTEADGDLWDENSRSGGRGGRGGVYRRNRPVRGRLGFSDAAAMQTPPLSLSPLWSVPSETGGGSGVRAEGDETEEDEDGAPTPVTSPDSTNTTVQSSALRRRRRMREEMVPDDNEEEEVD